MSITITINNNETYVDENCPELRIQRDLECQCVMDGKPYHKCPNCEGTGVDPIMSQFPYDYPYEMNVANSNFSTIWSALGLEKPACGEIHPTVLLKSLESVHPALMERADRSRSRQLAGSPESQDKGCAWFEFGVDAERVKMYIGKLTEIATEAAKREELVVWS
jgi:hypothetical protein